MTILPDYTVHLMRRSEKTGRLLKPKVRKFKGREAAINFVHNFCMASGREYLELWPATVFSIPLKKEAD